MRVFNPILVLLPLALLAACSSPESRIAGQRLAFEKYPAAVQQKIRAGQVDVGFTPDMVLLAYGEPDRKIARQTVAGQDEVWVYNRRGSHFSFGFGLASGGRHSSMGGGVGMSAGGYDPEESARVVFRAGLVTDVELITP